MQLLQSPPHYTVADLMKKMGHDHIEMLKMDIEGEKIVERCSHLWMEAGFAEKRLTFWNVIHV